MHFLKFDQVLFLLLLAASSGDAFLHAANRSPHDPFRGRQCTKRWSREWAPRTVPLADSEPQHVIIDDTFPHLQTITPASAEFRASHDGSLLQCLRRRYDAVHGPEGARSATSRNFAWEFWNADRGQYKLLRSPANAFFGPSEAVAGGEEGHPMGSDGGGGGGGSEDDDDPSVAIGAKDDPTLDLFEPLCEMLTTFGQQQLGMNAITPPWVSCYVDGCEQRLHTDPAQGPWAFVLSLTSDELFGNFVDSGAFMGGETVILRPQVLDYWRHFNDGYGAEEPDLFEVVPPRFGRLLAFDGRLPHGVRRVTGPQAMANGRLVVHGWFADPQPFFIGGLAPKDHSADGGDEYDDDDDDDDERANSPDFVKASDVLDGALAAAVEALAQVGRVTGCLSVKLTVSGATGKVEAVEALADAMVADPNDWQGPIGETELGETIYEDARADVLLVLEQALSSAIFPVAATGEDTQITVPFIFE